jgi:hypothetical protein
MAQQELAGVAKVDLTRDLPVKAQLRFVPVEACPSVLQSAISRGRPVQAEDEHALQRCDPRIEDLEDQLTATDTL